MIYIFEGMDNCLKDTLIQLLRSSLSPQTQILKFSNPPKNIDSPEDWQKAHFKDMFDFLESNIANNFRNLILNRAHLGEYVYAPIYRGYEGNWIFDLEEAFLKTCHKNIKKLKLFVLYDSDNDQLILREDDKSLSNRDIQKMDIERERFIKAFEKSNFTCKRIFDISNYTLDSVNKKRQIDVNWILKLMLEA
jgi:hypothetical protein